MRTNRMAALVLGAGALAACSEGATAPATRSPAFLKVSLLVAGDAATPTPVPGEFRVCKAGNTSGNFTITAAAPAGTTQGDVHSALATVTIPAGSCVVVAADNAPSGRGTDVTVTETNAANLTGITGARISTVTGSSAIANPGNGFGDFINSIHGVRLTFTNNAVSSGCTFTQGYYKNHESYVVTLLNGGTLNIGTSGSPVQLTADQIDAILGTPPKKGDAYYILTHQLITAELNILAGGSAPAAVQAAIAAGNELLADNAISASERAAAIAAADLLDKYNNGLIGPGHCN
jgi:hypothetical protein